MTQSLETVLTVQNLEELQNLKRKDLVALMKQFKEEDTDCLQEVNGKSKNDELIEALAEHMGFNIEQEVTAEVNKEIAEAVSDQADVMDFGGDVPQLEEQTSLFSEEPQPSVEEPQAEEQPQEETPQAESTGDEQVDALLAELGLDDIDVINPVDIQTPEAEQQAETENLEAEEMLEQFNKEKEKEEEPKKKATRARIPMDAPIPVRKYENLLIGVYGNILCEREEPFPEGHKFEGLVHEEIKLERFNPKAHEVFRNTKGHMHLLYTNTSSTYLIALKKPDGSIDPILEVTNKGRGHLRCRQLANMLQVAYNEKQDQEVISAEDYQKLTEQIELMPINIEGAGA